MKIKIACSLLVLSFLLIAALVSRVLLKMSIDDAENQVSSFVLPVSTNEQDLISFLEVIANYYPSGTKHERGSSLDNIVESARSNAITCVIERLRVVTKTNYGDGAQAWIDGYEKSQVGIEIGK